MKRQPTRPTRRPRKARPGTEPIVVHGFGDAVAVLMGMHDRFGHAHAAVALDAGGTVRDLTAFTADWHTIDTALSWVDCMITNDPAIARLVLLSAVQEDPTVLQESHVALFESARTVFGSRGVEVVDWIRFDGENFHSIGIALAGDDPNPWVLAAADAT